MKEFDEKDSPSDNEYSVWDELDPENNCVLDEFDEKELCNSDKINEFYQAQEEKQKREQEYQSLLEEQKLLKAERENLFNSGEDCSLIEQALRDKNQEIEESYQKRSEAEGRIIEARKGTIYEALDIADNKKKNYQTDMDVARNRDEYKAAYHGAEASYKASEHFKDLIYDLEHKKD